MSSYDPNFVPDAYQTSTQKRYEDRKKSGQIKNKSEEAALLYLTVEEYDKMIKTYNPDPSAMAAQSGSVVEGGLPEQKRRAEYYKNLAQSQNKGVVKNTQKAAGQFGNGSLLSPKKSTNLLGL